MVNDLLEGLRDCFHLLLLVFGLPQAGSKSVVQLDCIQCEPTALCICVSFDKLMSQGHILLGYRVRRRGGSTVVGGVERVVERQVEV